MSRITNKFKMEWFYSVYQLAGHKMQLVLQTGYKANDN